MRPENFLKTTQKTEVGQSILQSYLSPRFAAAINEIPKEWLTYSEDEVIEKLFNGIENISEIDIDLRRSFWVHYPPAIMAQEVLECEAVFENVCSDYTFYTVLKNPKRTLFIITEPTDQRQKTQKYLEVGWKRIQDALKMNVRPDEKGKIDSKMISLQFEIWKYLFERSYGKLTQKVQHEINQKTLQVNMTAEEARRDLNKTLTPAEIDEKLERLEEKAKALPAQKTEPIILDAITHQEALLQTNGRTVMEKKREDG